MIKQARRSCDLARYAPRSASPLLHAAVAPPSVGAVSDSITGMCNPCESKRRFVIDGLPISAVLSIVDDTPHRSRPQHHRRTCPVTDDNLSGSEAPAFVASFPMTIPPVVSAFARYPWAMDLSPELEARYPCVIDTLPVALALSPMTTCEVPVAPAFVASFPIMILPEVSAFAK